MRDAADQLLLIFKQQAAKAKDDATAQRVLKKESAQAERVHNKEANQPASPAPLPPLEVTYPAMDIRTLRGTPIISQDENDTANSAFAANTRLR